MAEHLAISGLAKSLAELDARAFEDLDDVMATASAAAKALDAIMEDDLHASEGRSPEEERLLELGFSYGTAYAQELGRRSLKQREPATYAAHEALYRGQMSNPLQGLGAAGKEMERRLSIAFSEARHHTPDTPETASHFLDQLAISRILRQEVETAAEQELMEMSHEESVAKQVAKWRTGLATDLETLLHHNPEDGMTAALHIQMSMPLPEVLRENIYLEERAQEKPGGPLP